MDNKHAYNFQGYFLYRNPWKDSSEWVIVSALFHRKCRIMRDSWRIGSQQRCKDLSLSQSQVLVRIYVIYESKTKTNTQWCAENVLQLLLWEKQRQERKKSWYAAFADFHGVKIPNMADFKLPVGNCWA